MTREKIDRRLAAILSADVAGYSRLMGIDETGTLGALRAHRTELIDPTIAEYSVGHPAFLVLVAVLTRQNEAIAQILTFL